MDASAIAQVESQLSILREKFACAIDRCEEAVTYTAVDTSTDLKHLTAIRRGLHSMATQVKSIRAHLETGRAAKDSLMKQMMEIRNNIYLQIKEGCNEVASEKGLMQEALEFFECPDEPNEIFEAERPGEQAEPSVSGCADQNLPTSSAKRTTRRSSEMESPIPHQQRSSADNQGRSSAPANNNIEATSRKEQMAPWERQVDLALKAADFSPDKSCREDTEDHPKAHSNTAPSLTLDVNKAEAPEPSRNKISSSALPKSQSLPEPHKRSGKGEPGRSCGRDLFPTPASVSQKEFLQGYSAGQQCSLADISPALFVPSPPKMKTQFGSMSFLNSPPLPVPRETIIVNKVVLHHDKLPLPLARKSPKRKGPAEKRAPPTVPKPEVPAAEPATQKVGHVKAILKLAVMAALGHFAHSASQNSPKVKTALHRLQVCVTLPLSTPQL
eukprot:gene7818-9286_t